MLHLWPGTVGVSAHGGRVAPSAPAPVGGLALWVGGGGGRLLPPEAPPLRLGRRGDGRLLKIGLGIDFLYLLVHCEFKLFLLTQ